MNMENIEFESNSAVENEEWWEPGDILGYERASAEQLLPKGCDLLYHAICNIAPTEIIMQLISSHAIHAQSACSDRVLQEALKKERWELVPVLLQHGADVNLGNDRQQTPLQVAVYNDAPEDIITQLISSHNINMQDEGGCTALHWAVRRKRWELVPVLLQHGADVNTHLGEQTTPLHEAVCEGAPADILTRLISPHNINMQNREGNAALNRAVYWKRWELVPVLLQYGADVNMCDLQNQSPLYLAIFGNAPADIIIQLISPHNINMQSRNFGNTALHEAVCKYWGNRRDLVLVLLQHGADVDVCDDYNHTPLHRAVRHGAPADIITLLISPHNINVQDVANDTALHMAVKENCWELVPVLLQHGADVNLGDRWNKTPLHVAVYNQATADIITQLISPRNINMQDRNGNTVLHVAVVEKRWELVPVLLQHGADVNLGDVWNQTPTHLAACVGAPADIITQLISTQNINMQDKSGDTSLHGAVRGKRWELVPVLLQHGANPFMSDIFPEPPRPLSLQYLTIATIRSHMPVKSDEAYEKLGLPHMFSELKLKQLAHEIVAIKRKEDVK